MSPNEDVTLQEVALPKNDFLFKDDPKQQEEIKAAQKPEACFSGGSTQHDALAFFFLERTNEAQQTQQQTLE